MDKRLYLIENHGCDDTTRGIAELNNEELAMFGKWISDLNKNSTYSCMPTVHIYELSWDEIREIDFDFQSHDCFDDDYIDKNDILYYNHKKYIWVDEYDKYKIRKDIVFE